MNRNVRSSKKKKMLLKHFEFQEQFMIVSIQDIDAKIQEIFGSTQRRGKSSHHV